MRQARTAKCALISPIRALHRSGAIDSWLQSPLARTEHELSLPEPVKGTMLARNRRNLANVGLIAILACLCWAVSTSKSLAIAATQTRGITNFVIDANPSNGGSRDDVLEKTVDYFTDASRTNPSVIVGFGQHPSGSGGIYLYTNNGSITGAWTGHTILASGNCYERTRPITFPGNTFPNVVASWRPDHPVQ
jgi:hypothetical protein